MYSFTCDYTEGAHPSILKRLAETNLQQEAGYGEDSFCTSAKDKIRKAIGCPEADVFLLVGGTQTNYTVIDGVLRGYEGVLAVQTGHIAVHEAGAIEFSGHKVLTLPQHEGKMDAGDLEVWLEGFYADETYPHMVQPGMVYISFPTEYGTIYSRAELEAIYARRIMWRGGSLPSRKRSCSLLHNHQTARRPSRQGTPARHSVRHAFYRWALSKNQRPRY